MGRKKQEPGLLIPARYFQELRRLCAEDHDGLAELTNALLQYMEMPDMAEPELSVGAGVLFRLITDDIDANLEAYRNTCARNKANAEHRHAMRNESSAPKGTNSTALGETVREGTNENESAPKGSRTESYQNGAVATNITKGNVTKGNVRKGNSFSNEKESPPIGGEARAHASVHTCEEKPAPADALADIQEQSSASQRDTYAEPAEPAGLFGTQEQLPFETNPLVSSPADTAASSAPAKKSRKRSKPELTGELAEWFEDEFWPLYPRKVEKMDARRALADLNPDSELRAEMIAGVQRALAREPNWIERNLRYIPHPATWIRHERWTDNLEPEPSSYSAPGASSFRSDPQNGEPNYGRNTGVRQAFSTDWDAEVAAGRDRAPAINALILGLDPETFKPLKPAEKSAGSAGDPVPACAGES